MRHVLFNIRYSARKFRRTPWLTLVLLLSIAIGIGTNVSILGFARGLIRAFRSTAGISRVADVFAFAAAATFLVASANVISFLLGRAFSRSEETSVRVALGARRMQLARELFWDSIVLSLAGGALGVLFAVWTIHIIPALLFEADADRLVFAPGLLNILTTSLACIGVIVLCGLIPILAVSDRQPAAVLKRESGGPSRTMLRVRSAIAIAQTASCCALLISAASLMDNLNSALQTAAGRGLGNPILATIQKHPDPGTGLDYFLQIEKAVRRIPGIVSTAWTDEIPGSQAAWQSFHVELQHPSLRDVPLNTATFTGAALNRLILPPKVGRIFGFADGNCPVAVINEAAARRLFGDESIGRVVLDPSGRAIEIIGIVAEKPSAAAVEKRAVVYYRDDPTRPGIVHFRAAAPLKLRAVELDSNVVSPAYFKAMGQTLVKGQGFSIDSNQAQCRIAVINQEAATRYFSQNAVGAAVIDNHGVRTMIAGVVNSRPLGVFQPHPEPAIYFPMSQDCAQRMTLILSIHNQNDAMLRRLRERIESVPGGGPAPVIIETLSTHLMHTALAPLRIATIVVGSSTIVVFSLSLLGLFGALNDAARQRRRDLAIRIALGSQRWRIIWSVLRYGCRLACAGAIIGALISLALPRFLAPIATPSHLPKLWLWFIGPISLIALAGVASLIPACNALLISPLTIVREDS